MFYNHYMSKIEIICLVSVYLAVSLVIFWGTNLIKDRFSREKLQYLTGTTGKSKQLTIDPCAYAIVGEPNAAEKYIKLIVTCKDGRQSRNTFNASVINTNTLEDLLKEFGRVNGVSVEPRSYECDMDSAPIVLTSKLRLPSTIYCRHE